MIRQTILIIPLILFLNKQSDAQVDQKFFSFQDTSFEVGSILRTYTILFNYDQATFFETSFAFLDSLKFFLISYPGLTVEVGMHRDTRGDDYYSSRLTQKRAEAIARHLVDAGINPRRIVAVGYEEIQPVFTEGFINKQDLNAREELHAKNRRVEIKILRIDVG